MTRGRLKQIAGIVIGLNLVVVGFACWECRPPEGEIVHHTSSKTYDVDVEYSCPFGVLSDITYSLKYRERESLFGLTSTAAELVELTGGGSVLMVSDSVAFASLGGLPHGVGYTQFLVNLGCDFEKLEMDEYSIPKMKDTVFTYARESMRVSLALMDSGQRLYRMSSEAGLPSALKTDVYILGALDARVLDVDRGAVRLEVWWNCSEARNIYSYSLESGIIRAAENETSSREGSS